MPSSSGERSPRAPVGSGVTTTRAAPRKSSLFACVVALSNTLLGVSVVTVSGAFARAGCAAGTIFLVVFACTSACGLHLLARSSLTVSAAVRRRKAAETETDGGVGKVILPQSSFRAVAMVGAPRWAFLIDFAVALKCFGVGTSYLILVGSLMTTVMSEFVDEGGDLAFLVDRQFWVTVGFLLAAPMASSRTLGALRYVATAAIGLVVLVAVMVLSFWLLPSLDACPTAHEEDAGGAQQAASLAAATHHVLASTSSVTSYSTVDGFNALGDSGDEGSCFEEANLVGSVKTMLQTLPLFVFCFTCHQNIFTICDEIVRPTVARIDAVIGGSLTVAVILYLTLCWGSYATYGDGVSADLLDMYPDTGFLTAARVAITMLVISCYPLQAHPCRLCILSALKPSPRVDLQEGKQNTQGTIPGDGSSSSLPIRYQSVATDAPAGPHRDEDSGVTIENGRNTDRTDFGDENNGPDIAAGAVASSKRRGLDNADQTEDDEEIESALYRNNEDDQTLPRDRQHLLDDLPLSDDDPRSKDQTLVDESKGLVNESGGASFPGTLLDCSWIRSPAWSAREGGDGATSFWSSAEGARHIAVTAAILWSSYAIAMTVADLGLVLEIVGATGSTTIAFILPGLLYLKVHPEPHAKRSLAAMQLIAGLLFIPVALTSIALGGESA